MRALTVVLRLLIAIVTGWPLALAPLVLSGHFGSGFWGAAHSGLPLLLYPVAVWVVYLLLGLIPPFKSKDHNADRPRRKTQHADDSQ